jgi:hypothetical protein
MSIDFDVLVQGSSIMLESVSDKGDQWAERNIPAGTPRWSNAYVFDQQSFASILARLQREGLGVRQVGR